MFPVLYPVGFSDEENDGRGLMVGEGERRRRGGVLGLGWGGGREVLCWVGVGGGLDKGGGI